MSRFIFDCLHKYKPNTYIHVFQEKKICTSHLFGLLTGNRFTKGNLGRVRAFKSIQFFFSLSLSLGGREREKSLLSCQPRVTVMSCFVYKVIWDLESIDHLLINPIRRIGLIHKRSFDSR